MYLQLEMVRMVVFSLQIMFIATPLLAFFFRYFLARIRSTFQSYLPKNSWMIMHKKHFALTEISCFCMMEIASRLLLFWVCARMNVLICFYNSCWMCLFSLHTWICSNISRAACPAFWGKGFCQAAFQLSTVVWKLETILKLDPIFY